MKCDLLGMGIVYYHPPVIANKLSQSKANKKYGFEVKYSNRRDKNGSGDLAFDVKTRGMHQASVLSNKKGLHVLDCKGSLKSERTVVYLERRSIY